MEPEALDPVADLEMVAGMRSLGRRCAECGEPDAAKHCSRCKVTSYCSEGCQQAAWKLAHRKHCRPNPTRALMLRSRTVFSPDAATAQALWFLLPPHPTLPRTREGVADLITPFPGGPSEFLAMHSGGWANKPRVVTVAGWVPLRSS